MTFLMANEIAGGHHPQQDTGGSSQKPGEIWSLSTEFMSDQGEYLLEMVDLEHQQLSNYYNIHGPLVLGVQPLALGSHLRDLERFASHPNGRFRVLPDWWHSKVSYALL
ncbi:uncharacterized protein BO88DRAFT_473291 [Aspergillus vadensis CBS 113365]|uniref:Uncharacterized protein n=1 Tax=Aspergillus vadensis (strain CBS 113365 / IMI 142717 / IBT 24658) TaxID=1448311 RepID=A0A319BJ62_ASPVC|nr:hypothetical protein BO88DRAFT_473291 [Aspergillus vadensis CBS 113365]PYH72667.1 hypothetical protein BO88DRAFT_473291 [Aspergillus vadensis CBS 113365]